MSRNKNPRQSLSFRIGFLNSLLRLNYEVEKKMLPDYVTKVVKNWVWVFGIKMKNLPVLPVLPDVHINNICDKPNENMGKLGKLSKTDISNNTEQHTQMSYYSSAVLGKNIAVIKACEEWENQHQETINSTNITKVCFALKPMFPDINMDDLATHIRKYAKITPTNSNDNGDSEKPPQKEVKGKEIEIPFKGWSKERLKAGKKTATSRTNMVVTKTRPKPLVTFLDTIVTRYNR